MSETERDEFTSWAAARRPALLRAASLLTRDHGQAEDLVQVALVKVAARWGRLRTTNPDAYARTVMYRDQISWWRRRREVVEVPGGDQRGRAIEAEATEDSMVMRQALARLTPKQRAVLVLRFYEDLSERDAAQALGVSPGTVKSQTSLALRRLREGAPEVKALRGIEAEPNE
jgi:RNA polymerase sigma-70 factor (sigma-E family)